MARSFQSYTIKELQPFIDSLQLKRKITHIQIHHAWKPRKTDYRGEITIQGMWRYHTGTRGWQDIGQHFSISPDGLIWDGRSLEKDPAGIAGYNKGGIMFEIIGNFDKGEEVLEGKQLDATIAAVRSIMEKFSLSLQQIVFHREHAPKTCPGTGLTKDWFLEEVRNRRIEEIEKQISYDEAADWKKINIDWLYKEGFLSSEDWKKSVEQGLPLWAEALVLRRIFDKSQM